MQQFSRHRHHIFLISKEYSVNRMLIVLTIFLAYHICNHK